MRVSTVLLTSCSYDGCDRFKLPYIFSLLNFRQVHTRTVKYATFKLILMVFYFRWMRK